jgi:hypothetical protein
MYFGPSAYWSLVMSDLESQAQNLPIELIAFPM